jgi:uroporphyrinogen decarboxylase
MAEMKPRERVLKALQRGIPDQIPWVENGIEEELQERIMGTTEFTPGDLCAKLRMDGFGGDFPAGEKNRASQAVQEPAGFKQSYYFPKRITFDFIPPWIAEMGVIPETGRAFIKRGLLDKEDSLKLFDELLPDPDHPARYERVSEWIARFKGDYAVFAHIRIGSSPLLESMGIEQFAYNVFDRPDFVKEVHRRFSEWTIRVLEHLNRMDFDFYWANDDLASTQSTFMSPAMYREFFLPYQKMVAEAIKKPWVFHSDGNLMPILDDLLTLGMSGLHPIQPSAMDIEKIKSSYGTKVCILGNIDLDYTLTRGTPDEVDKEVKERIAVAGPGGGYIITSANSLPNYCKTENVLAMSQAIQKYGKYPLDPRLRT